MKSNELIKMNLQLFAEETEDADITEDDQNKEEAENSSGAQDEETESEKQEKSFTAEQVAKMIDDRLERERKTAEKRKAEAERLAGMNAQERAAEELKKMKDKLAEFEKRESVNAMSKEANKMLREASIPIRDSIVAGLVRESAEETQTAVNDFISMIGEIKVELLKEKYTGKSPKVNTSTTEKQDEWTKEKIMQVKDDKKRQDLIVSHPDLFGLKK